MTGRDIVKFILYNNLLDKEYDPSSKLILIDHLVDDSSIVYEFNDQDEFDIKRVSMSPRSVIQETLDFGCVDNLEMPELKSLDSLGDRNAVVQIYNTYNTTFYQWLKTITYTSLFGSLLDYIAEDSNFYKNSKTFNQLISYLENKSVSVKLISEAKLAWMQYRRECGFQGGDDE